MSNKQNIISILKMLPDEVISFRLKTTEGGEIIMRKNEGTFILKGVTLNGNLIKTNLCFGENCSISSPIDRYK